MAEFTANIHDGRGPVQTNGLRDYRVRRRVALVVITGMMTVFWTGASIGWGPMQLLLEGDGAFEDQCTKYEPRPCPAQTTKLLNVNFYAQLTLILSPVFGIFMDLYGPLCMTTLSTVFLIAGFGGVILAVARDIDVLLYISFFFVSMMTMTTYQSIIQVGMLFRGKTQQRVILLMNALLDSGTLTYLGLWAIQDASGVRLEFLISAYLLAGTCVFGAAMYLWHVVVPVSAGANDNNEETTEEPKLVANAEEREGNIDREGGPMPKGANFTMAETKSLNDNLYLRIGDPEIKVNTKKSKDDGQDVAIPPNDSTTVDNAVAPNDGYGEDGDGNHVLVSELSILQQLKSKQFLLLLVFYTFYSCFNVMH
ncbi:hypothetical protein ACHAW5_009131 [Stephanodiscus triporus]|uniref:Solute carrier family 40 protein n=1 Tax=Stephanodiscus triporus TaxID=2934178 RepID=A0ABD3NGD2_9STRA